MREFVIGVCSLYADSTVSLTTQSDGSKDKLNPTGDIIILVVFHSIGLRLKELLISHFTYLFGEKLIQKNLSINSVNSFSTRKPLDHMI